MKYQSFHFHIFLKQSMERCDFYVTIAKVSWFAPVIEGLLYDEDFTTNWFLRTWPYMEFICTCSNIVKICVPYAASKLRSAICGDTFEM